MKAGTGFAQDAYFSVNSALQLKKGNAWRWFKS
jgi:hypothetical protein